MLAAGDGLAVRPGLPSHIIEYAHRTGQVAVPFRGVVMSPELVGCPEARRRAALLVAGPGSVLSHVSALAAWGLPASDVDGVHVLTGPERRIRIPGIVQHRRPRIDAVIRAGLPVTRLERALVDSWPLGAGDARRAPVLLAVGARRTTPDRVAEVLAEHSNLPGRGELLDLIAKLRAGCRSELELWGYDRIFVGPGMPPLARQVPVRLGTRTVYLDVFHEPTGTNFELDGAKWHAGAEERERDLRRDAALATRGIRVVRFTHDRLLGSPDEVRREVLAILAVARVGAGRIPAL